MIIDKYPGIKKAALLIAYDNGIINRLKPEQQWLESLDAVLGTNSVAEEDLDWFDQWLLSLDETNFHTACCGEETDMKKVADMAPSSRNGESMHKLLNTIFEA